MHLSPPSSSMPRYVVGWDLPSGMPKGVLRLVCLVQPQWTCLYCVPQVFARIQEHWPSLRARVIDDLRSISGWCFFGFESLQADASPVSDGTLRSRLLQASMYLDQLLPENDPDRHRQEVSLQKETLMNPSLNIWRASLSRQGLPIGAMMKDQASLHAQWIEQGMQVAFEHGWQQWWQQIGLGRMRGFLHTPSGYFYAANVRGEPDHYPSILRIPATAEQTERLLVQAKSLWAMSAASKTAVAPEMEPAHFAALYAKAPELTLRMLSDVPMEMEHMPGQGEHARDMRQAFINKQLALAKLPQSP